MMDSVYLPEEDSYLIRDALEDRIKIRQKTADRRPITVLDMGTGSGILAIAAARLGCEVTAADLNPDAIAYARKASKKDNLEIDHISSDLFQNIDKTYDIIVFNPPYVPTEPGEKRDPQSIAWQGGKDGKEVISRFLSNAKEHLNEGGEIILIVSSVDDKVPRIPDFKSELLSKKSYFFERLFVLRLT